MYQAKGRTCVQVGHGYNGRVMYMKTDFDLNSIITIGCPIHGDFKMVAGDHIGENNERIAYGCPKCGDHKALSKFVDTKEGK